MVKVWRARDVVCKYSSDITVTTAAAIDTFFSTGTAFEALLKTVTISEPEGTVEKIDLLGETSGFQNAELEDKPWSLAKISGTLVHPGDEGLEIVSYGAGTAISSTHTRYQPGNDGRPLTTAFLVNLDDGTDEVSVVLDNARVTKLGDRTIGGADGHVEQSFEAVCLPKDFYVEFKN